LNKLKKTATDISDASQPTDDSQVLTHLPTEQTISAEIADLLISHKLDQISPATAAKLLAQAAALENNQSPKLTQAATTTTTHPQLAHSAQPVPAHRHLLAPRAASTRLMVSI